MTIKNVFRASLYEMKDDPCWDGYEMVGKKEKNGKEVPNCVPKKEHNLDESYDFGENDEITLEGIVNFYLEESELEEGEYQGRKVKLNKPMQGDVKKFKVYTKNPKGNVVKVNFGDPDMRIKKSNPARRKSFRARHNCESPGPKHKARYWSCKKWEESKLEEGKGRNSAIKRKAKKKDQTNTSTVTSINKATGEREPIGKYGKTKILSTKDKDRDSKRRRRQSKRDMSISEDISEDFINEMVDDFQNAATFQFNEDTINILAEAFMQGFLSSSEENNGQNCKAVYKNSALKPDGEVWNKALKERFRRFVYNKRKQKSE